MTKPLVTLLLLLYCSTVYAAQDESCLETAITQSEMNNCGEIMLKEADQELNRIYQAILRIYKEDTVFIGKLKSAQRLWIKLRDADLEMRYPQSEDAQFVYGSVYPLCVDAFLTQRTFSRISLLKQWLVGYEEGDVCHGSLINKDKL